MKVRNFVQENQDSLAFHAVTKTSGFSRDIIPFVSKDEVFPVQVWAKKEFLFLEKISPLEQKKYLQENVDLGVVVVIFAGGHSFPIPVVEEAKRKKIALVTSPFSRKKCKDVVARLYDVERGKVIPGGLLEIFGMGVLILGDSGVGKSESALELISRGHRFVSDDATKCWVSKGRLLGEAPEISRHFMEIRGLGIINILEIFGSQAICPRTEIKLVIKLQRWKEGKEYDRMRLQFPRKFDIFGVKVPQLRIPVAPGRNLSNLIEVACRVHVLREKGYNAPEEIEKRLNSALLNKKNKKKGTP